MTPFLSWHKKLRHSPVFTELRMVGRGGGEQRQFFSGVVDNEDAFWDQYNPAARGALEIPENEKHQRVRYTVYRLSAAGNERPATREDLKVLGEYRRDATIFADAVSAGEFTARA